ncbi:MAG: PAS domain-containing protein [Verrucomicrobia bacterium]|nr:PAS domain-containing protein [Verrucomicrobiota bacterium]
MEALIELLSQHWPGVLFRQKPDLTFATATPYLAEVTGCSIDEWRNQSGLFWRVVHELDVDLVQQHLDDVAASGEGRSCSFRLRHKGTGRIAYISEFRRASRDSSGQLTGYEGLWMNITQQALAERRLATAAWKETLGLLTLGLSHDFNNLLAGIMGLSEAYLSQIEPNHPFREGLQLVHKNSQQAAQLIRRIAQLHRGRTGTRGYHDLNNLVKEGAELIGKVIPKRIEVASNLASEQLPLYIDPVEFQQTIINLALNAAEAMPEQGRIVLRTFAAENAPETGQLIGITPRPPVACFEITDTGAGIKPQHLPFIFDPFFTTKPMNRGSGLGLYNVRLFAEKHGSRIAVETQEGQGTTFRIWFPVADFTEADEAMETSNRRRRSLLLAGSPGGLRDSTAEFLRVHNYHVVDSDRAAEDLLQSSDYQFDGVFILAEPKSSLADQLARFIRARKLPVKIILKTAGSDPDELDSDLIARCDLLITPDLSEDHLLDKLAATFDLRSAL